MQKVYLLLRNNQQSGPYTLEELIQKGLNFLDLVWIEGKSTSWSYPVEIEVLKPYLSTIELNKEISTDNKSEEKPAFNTLSKTENTNEVRRKVFVSFPGQDHFQSTTTSKPITDANPDRTLPERSIQPSSYNYTEQQIKNTETHYNRPLKEVEEEYTNWVYQQKAKKINSISKQKVAVSAVIIAGFAIGYIVLKTFIVTDTIYSNKAVENPSVIDPYVKTENESTESTQIDNKPEQKIIYTTKKTQSKTLEVPKKEKDKIRQHQQAPVSTITSNEEVHAANEPIVPATDDPISTEKNEIETHKQKKKSIGQKIDDFFDKFSKKEKPAEENIPATTPDEKTGERKSKRRGDETPTVPEAADISQMIDITSNAPSENWMMGIQGLKLTLTNRSNERIETASVEVRYYDERNTLIEKRIVRFSNIGPKKSQTISAPDHRLADHVDYQLITTQSIKAADLKLF